MASILSSIGRKVSDFLGEPYQGSTPSSETEEDIREQIFTGSSFAKLLNYQSFDEETQLFFSSTSMGFVIEAVPLVGLDESVEKEFLSLIQETMQEGSTLQFLLLGDHRVEPILRGWRGARRQEPFRAMTEKRSKFLTDSKSVSARNLRLIISYAVPKGLYERGAVCDTKERILSSIRSFTYAETWGKDAFLETTGALVNFSLSTETNPCSWNPYELLSDQLPRGSFVRVRSDRLTWNEEVEFRTYRAVDFPKFMSPGRVQSLIGDATSNSHRINTPFLLHYGIYMPKQDEAYSSFRKKMVLTENQGNSGWLVRMVPQLAEELSECDHVRRSIEKGDKIVWTQLAVGIWSTPESLANNDQSIRSVFRKQGLSLAENKMTHLPHFLSFLPMGWGKFALDLNRIGLTRTTLATEACNLIPSQGEWSGTSSPGLLLVGRRGEILNWNPFDNPSGNYNVVITGKSGSGKSVFMQEFVMSALGTGARVYIFDVGRSYDKMNSMVGGQLINFSRDYQICLNPFSNISTDSDEERNLSFVLLKSIVATMAAPNQGTNDWQNGTIERAIQLAWQSKQNKATITDVAKALSEMEDRRAQDLSDMLTPYCRGGIYEKYFEGECNVDFSNPLVLIELEDLKEMKDLQRVVLQLFMVEITNRSFLGDRKTPFHLFVDEAWDLLQGGTSAKFFETLARRLRKYNGSLVIGTQDIEDLYASPEALAVFKNSDWTCFLSQKNDSIERAVNSGKINLSPGKKAALESVEKRDGMFSEVMICDGEGSYSIGRLYLDPFSQLLYSTKASDYTLVNDLRSKGMSVVQAVETVLEARNA